MVRLFLTIVLAALWLVPSRAFSTDFQSPHTMGLGGAGHAAPFVNDSIYMNPSFISLTQYKGLSANYLWHDSDARDSNGVSIYKGQSYNFSVLDGSPDSIFQAGVGYTKRGDATFLHIGASKSIITQLGVGLGTKMIFPSGTTNRFVDGTVSFTGVATQWFAASIIVDNLLQAATAIGLYREFILGTKFNIQSIVSIYFDPLWVPTLPTGPKFGYAAGIELTLFSDFGLRFGKFLNSNIPFQAQRGDGFGVGIGWLGPKISVDYGLSRVTAPIASIAQNIGITIFF